MSVNNPAGNNPQSGRSVGLPDEETAVTFTRPFNSAPHVVISAWSDKEVWLVAVTAAGFTWLNSADEIIVIDWIADAQ